LQPAGNNWNKSRTRTGTEPGAAHIHTRFKFPRIDIHKERGSLPNQFCPPSPIAERETTLTTKSDEARARAEASFKKEERAKEGAKAMMEYQANSQKVREKTERLRALRLAKEAADKERAASAR
jgi:hypothetical protein